MMDKGIYRKGGRGRENVLTAEAFQVLYALPRDHFLGPIIDGMQAGDTEAKALLRAEIEDANFEFLPGDIGLVQPDGVLASNSVYAFIEAKRLRASSFMPHQLARQLVTVCTEARRLGKRPLLLLLLGEQPPVLIRSLGRKSLRDAIEPHLEAALKKLPACTQTQDELIASIDSVVAWTTWGELRAVMDRGAAHYVTASSADRAVRRMVALLDATLRWHDKEPA